MNEQPEALRLADALDDLMGAETLIGAVHIDKASYELRRLHKVNVYLKDVYESLVKDREELFDDLAKVETENERLREAVLAEREACAKVCEETRFPDSYTAIRCAAAIRARSEQEPPR